MEARCCSQWDTISISGNIPLITNHFFTTLVTTQNLPLIFVQVHRIFITAEFTDPSTKEDTLSSHRGQAQSQPTPGTQLPSSPPRKMHQVPSTTSTSAGPLEGGTGTTPLAPGLLIKTNLNMPLPHTGWPPPFMAAPSGAIALLSPWRSTSTAILSSATKEQPATSQVLSFRLLLPVSQLFMAVVLIFTTKTREVSQTMPYTVW